MTPNEIIIAPTTLRKIPDGTAVYRPCIVTRKTAEMVELQFSDSRIWAECDGVAIVKSDIESLMATPAEIAHYNAVCEARDQLRAERDSALALLKAEQGARETEVASLREEIEKLKAEEPSILVARIDELKRENAKLQRFKDYVHKRLDEAGVPVDPDPAKTAETGCRISRLTRAARMS